MGDGGGGEVFSRELNKRDQAGDSYHVVKRAIFYTEKLRERDRIKGKNSKEKRRERDIRFIKKRKTK